MSSIFTVCMISSFIHFFIAYPVNGPGGAMLELIIVLSIVIC